MNPWLEEHWPGVHSRLIDFIDLKALVNQVHEAGRYHMLDYRRLPDVPLPQADQEWLRGINAG